MPTFAKVLLLVIGIALCLLIITTGPSRHDE